jgi:hypothetical protein
MQFHTDFQYDPAQDRRAECMTAVRIQNTDFGVTISKFLCYKLVIIHIL